MNKNQLLPTLSLLLAGCASSYNTLGDNVYLDSKNGKPLVIPAPLTDKNLSHFYQLPTVKGKKKISAKPPKVALEKSLKPQI